MFLRTVSFFQNISEIILFTSIFTGNFFNDLYSKSFILDIGKTTEGFVHSGCIIWIVGHNSFLDILCWIPIALRQKWKDANANICSLCMTLHPKYFPGYSANKAKIKRIFFRFFPTHNFQISRIRRYVSVFFIVNA